MKKIVKAFLTAFFAVFTLFTFVACNGNKGCADDAHTWDNGALIKKATCTEKGAKKYTCTTCDEEKWEIVEALGHTTNDAFSYDANSHWHECKVCHEKVDYNSHNLKITTISEATCSQKGSEMVECEECDFYAVRETEKAAHKILVDAAVAPTCSSTGLTEGKHCETCGEILVAQKVVNKLEHKVVVEVEISKAATCEEDGVYTNVTKCEECGEIIKREANLKLNKLGHKLGNLHERVEPTCEEDGNVAYYECETCHKNFADKDAKNELKDAVTLYHTGHALKFHYGKDATCEEKGYKYYYTCDKCNYTTFEEIEALGHDMVAGVCTRCNNEQEYASLESIIKTGKANDKFTIVGKVVAIYSGDRFNGIFVANGEYAIQLFGKGNNAYKNVKIGDIVEATGTYAFFASNRTTELNTTEIKVFANGTRNSQYHEPVAYTFDASTFKTITKSSKGSDNVYSNRPITVTGVVSKTIQSNRQINLTVDGIDVPVFFKSQAAVGNDIFNFMKNLKVGEKITVTGVIGSYNGTTQIIAPSMPSMAHIHNFENKIISDKYFASAPTCTSKARYYYSCECGEKGTETFEDESTKMTSHITGLIVPEISATCDQDGVIAHYQCLICKKNLNKNFEEVDSLVIKALGHTYDETKWLSDETNHFHKCIRCDAQSDVTEHTFNWIIDKEATEDEKGLKHEECDVCHFIRNKNTEIPQLAHTHVLTHVDAKNATCLEKGNVEYYVCSKCKKTFEDEEGTKEIKDVTTTGDHDYGTWIDEIPATYDVDGVKGHYTCSVCNRNFDKDHFEIADLTIEKLERTPLAAPVVTVNSKTGEATWNKVENATSYDLYVNGGRTGEVTDTTSYILTDGDKFYVVAKSTDEKYSETKSNEVELIKTTGLGTQDDPYTVSDALKLIGKLYTSTTSTDQYYVKGLVEVVTTKNDNYNFNITDGTNTINTYGIAANGFTLETVLGTGYDVVVLAKMGVFNNNEQLSSGKLISATKVTVSFEKKSVSEFLEIGASSTNYEVTGIVSEIVNTTYGNLYLTDANDSTKKVYVYGTLTPAGEAQKFSTLNIEVGDTLTVIGHLELYGKTLEINQAVFVSVTKKTEFTVTLANPVENATIEGLPTTTVTKGTKVEFTVTPSTGYKVSYVQVEGETIAPAADGTYSFVVNQDVEVNIVVVEESSSVKQTLSTEFDKKSAKHQPYIDSWKYGDFTIFGGANNNADWAFVKMGGNNKNLPKANPVYIETTNTVSFAVSKVVVKTNKDNLSKGGSVKSWGVIVYDAKGTVVDTVLGKAMTKSKAEEFTFVASEGVTWKAGYKYRVNFEIASSSSKNGVVWIDDVTLYE